MNTKKSLGHFPFGSTAQKKSKLSFIPDINGTGEKSIDDVASAFEETEEDIEKRLYNKKLQETESELVERDLPADDESEPVKKKVASYYIDESVINRLKAFADSEDASYSSVVSDAIEVHVGKRGY